LLVFPLTCGCGKKNEHGKHYELPTVLEDDYESETSELWRRGLLAHAADSFSEEGI
jgi:hypothetical protein